MKLVNWIFGICLFTSSWDLLLVFEIGGRLRLAQILMLFVMLAAAARIYQDGRVLWPYGMTPLMLWLALQYSFIPFSGNVNFGLQFTTLLALMVFGIFAVAQVWGLYPRIEGLMRVYLASFFALASFGMLQFIGPAFFHVTMPFTTQWFVHGRVPRINGLNFEPSYYATYMIIGWIMMMDLRWSKARIAQSRLVRWGLPITTMAMFFCSSKVGWVCMLAELAARGVPRMKRWFKRARTDVREGRLIFAMPRTRNVVIAVCLLGAFVGVVAVAAVVLPSLTILISGTGLAGTPAHSLLDRTNRLGETWDAFLTSPFIGRSLGGVPVQIARAKGLEVNDLVMFRFYWGFPVLLDILTASGLIGFVPFLVFLWSTTFGAVRAANKRISDERAKWVHALARAMIFEWIVLFNDQNSLRLYLWLHFAMVVVIRYHLENVPAEAVEYIEPKVPALLPGAASEGPATEAFA